MNFDGAVVSVIYTGTPKEFIIPRYVRDKFKFILSNSLFLKVIKEARENKERRDIGFIKNIGPLRVGVKEQWHQIILSFKSLSKISGILIPPLVPLYAVSKKQFQIEVTDKSGEPQRYSGKVIVSIYPVFSFSIRLVFKINNKVSPGWIIDFLKQQSLDVNIVYKNQNFSRFVDFASYIKLWTLLSLFNTKYVRQVNVNLSKQSNSVYLKGDKLLRDIKTAIGIALGVKNYENLSPSVIAKYTKYMSRRYNGDVVISSERGFVVYSPYLSRNGSELQRKRFRRNIFLAAEIAYVTKNYLKKSAKILKTAARENTRAIPDLITRTFVTANPFALGKYRYIMGLLKPHTLQKLYKSIMFKLELLGIYSSAISANKTILSNILTPELVDLYTKINTLALPVTTDALRKLYYESREQRIPELLKQLEVDYPEKYKDIATATVSFLLEEFKKDYFSWDPEKRKENLVGWRTITEICNGLNKGIKEGKFPQLGDKPVNKDVFYKHTKKGRPGIIPLLEMREIIKIEEISSRGRGGKAKKVRINPELSAVKNLLIMSEVENYDEQLKKGED